MKKLFILIFALLLSSYGWGQTLYEGFDYTVGPSIGGNTATTGGPVNNWYTHNNTKVGSIDITAGNLSYAGLQTSVGNKVRLPGDNITVPRDVNRPITGTGATVAYFSALINIVDVTQLSAAGDYFMHFGATSGITNTSFGGRLGAKSVNSGSNFRFIIQNTSTGTLTFTEFATDMVFGTTYLVVVKYDKSASPTVASLWVNPVNLGGTEPAGSVQNNSGTATFAAFGSICLRNTANTPKADIDEIRVGTTWASVTPLNASTPIISVPSPTSLSGFLTTSGTPSTAQTFTVSGTSIQDFLVVTAPSNYELRESGVGSYGSSVSFAQTSGIVSSKTIEVRIAASAAVGTPSGNVVCSSTNATSQNVAVSGNVTSPLISTILALPTSFTGFTYVQGSGPSASQTYNLSGSNLTPASGNLTLTGSTNYEVSTDNTSFSVSATVAYTSGTLASTPVYIRLKSGLSGGNYNSENIVNSGGGATSVNVTCSGNITIPVSAITITGALTTFGNQVVNTISTEKTYTVSGVNLTDNIVITPPSGFEISTTTGSGFASTPITLTRTGGVVATTSIYVRFAPIAVQAYSGNITHVSSGATTQNVVVSGTGVCIAASLPFVEDFNYSVGALLTNNCWNAHSAGGTNPITIVTNSISYPSYLSSEIGNETSLPNTGEDDSRIFASQTSGNIYASFLVNISAATTTGDYFLHLGPSNISTTFRGRVFVKKDNNNNVFFGIAQSGTAAYSATPYALATTYLIVLKYSIVAGTNNDVASIFINPTLNAVEPISGWTVNTDATTDIADIGTIALRQSSATTALKIDGIRVSTVWSDIVGAISSTPELAVTPTSLTGFTYVQGNGPSAEQSVSVSGQYLTNNLTITPPANYEISTGTGAAFVATSPITLTPTSGTVAATPIYVRLKAGLASASYNGEIITISSTSATDKTVSCDGTVDAVPDPTITVAPTSLSGFSAISGTPSLSQSYTVSGSNLVDDVTILAPANYELSTDNVNFTGSLLLNHSAGIITGQPITVYVRIATSATVGVANGNITHTSLNLTTVNLALTGNVYYPEPSNHVSNFTAVAPNYSSVTVTWSDNDGAQAATGYMILANTTGVFTPPVDGIAPTIDANLTDGTSVVTVNHGTQTYTWNGLISSSHYYFTIYPFTNTGININYKTTPTAPTADVTTQVYVQPLAAWTFDDLPVTDATTTTPTSVAANVGIEAATAMLYANGTNGSSTWLPSISNTELNSFSGTTLNDPREGSAIIAGQAYSPNGGASLSANGKSMVIKFSMANYKDPILTYATRGTTSGFTSQQWAWSTDNITYTNFTNVTGITTSFVTKTMDMSGIDQLDQATDVYLRVTFTGATNSTGNNRLDNLVINATEVPLTKSLQVKLFLQGLYDATTSQMKEAKDISLNPKWGTGIADLVTVELHDAVDYTNVLYSSGNIYLTTDGISTVSDIPNNLSDSYYITILHRNSIETTCATPISFIGQSVDYDFTASASMAFGNNLKYESTGVYSIYGGDANHDGIVDGSDMAAIDNASTLLLLGYNTEDVNGDGIVDGSDMAIIDNNSTSIVTKQTP